MAELTPDIAAVVKAACEQNAEEAAGCFSRTLDLAVEVSVGPTDACNLEELPAGCDGPGLLVLFKFGEIGAIGILPEQTGLLPEWYSDPDPTGQSKLTTLSQELSMLLVPEEFMADDFQAAKVASLSGALASAGVRSGAGMVPLTLSAGERTGVFSFIWPCSNPAGAFLAGETEAGAKPEPAMPASKVAAAAAASSAATATAGTMFAHVDDLEDLPPYTRSLLRIKVPVMVSLASKKQSIHQIVELGPGSIIKFEKSCEEMLDLEVGGHPIAQGEAVKVGDKFGLRINSMILPGERFKQLSPRRK